MRVLIFLFFFSPIIPTHAFFQCQDTYYQKGKEELWRAKKAWKNAFEMSGANAFGWFQKIRNNSSENGVPDSHTLMSSNENSRNTYMTRYRFETCKQNAEAALSLFNQASPTSCPKRIQRGKEEAQKYLNDCTRESVAESTLGNALGTVSNTGKSIETAIPQASETLKPIHEDRPPTKRRYEPSYYGGGAYLKDSARQSGGPRLAGPEELPDGTQLGNGYVYGGEYREGENEILGSEQQEKMIKSCPFGPDGPCDLIPSP